MERTYTVDELLGAIRRRWKWMAIVAGTVFALAAIVIAKMPNEYRARALAMIEPSAREYCLLARAPAAFPVGVLFQARAGPTLSGLPLA